MVREVDARTQFGRNVRAARTRLGVSQVELGASARLHRTEVSLLERGERDPRLTTILRLARALGVAPAALVEGL